MPYEDILLDSEDRMEKAVNALKAQFRTLRSGRANPGLVENTRVDAYGTPTNLRSVATISIPEPRQILIRPFDRALLGEIEKAILKSDIGLTPNNDGKVIRLPVPPLSEERRKQMVSRLKDMGEETKVAIRNIRRDANKQADKEKKDGDLTEDDLYAIKEEIQELTNRYEKLVDDAVQEKTAELMEV
ncbi:MAG TPA: ribosome recycling factor [Planctomycetota bacterium]|nr:ribosome recycling factor [Planctomycetota bacterium]